MTAAQRPRLGRWGTRGNSPGDDRIVIFVHGIFSDSKTFDNLLSHLSTLDPGHDFDFWIFDYDYRQTFATSADQLAQEIAAKSFGTRQIDIVGHSMGGLVARMAVLRHQLKYVARIVTLATPNHGTISGAQLNLLGQMTSYWFRRLQPIYARAPGILDLTNAHRILQRELKAMHATAPNRLDGKSYVSIPAQYFHLKRQAGDPPPSIMMGSLTKFRQLLNTVSLFRITLTAVHDGIVEERSNQLYPPPIGSDSEGGFMPARSDALERILHATHKAGEDCDHVTVTACSEIADLIQAVLRAGKLEAADIDRFLKCPPGQIALRPTVV